MGDGRRQNKEAEENVRKRRGGWGGTVAMVPWPFLFQDQNVLDMGLDPPIGASVTSILLAASQIA